MRPLRSIFIEGPTEAEEKELASAVQRALEKDNELILEIDGRKLDLDDWDGFFVSGESVGEGSRGVGNVTDEELESIVRVLSHSVAGALTVTLVGKDTEEPVREAQETKEEKDTATVATDTSKRTKPPNETKLKTAQSTPQGTPGDASEMPMSFKYILIRRTHHTPEDLVELRAAVVGNVDAGKSSLLGVLTKGKLDDGRGKARVALFRHRHEIETGRTSSVGMELIGFDASGDVVVSRVHTNKQQVDWEDITSRSAKLVAFCDLAGHEKYLKTTLFGLTSSVPDFVLLVVGANAGVVGMCKEHLSVALALGLPVVCVVTKIDMAPPGVLDQTLSQLKRILRSPGCRKTPFFVENATEAYWAARRFTTHKICPVFLVSNVTGAGHDPLRVFLNAAPPEQLPPGQSAEPLEFSVTDVFNVPYVGTVVSGVILAGHVSVNDAVYLGPDSLGKYIPTTIRSIHRKRADVTHAEAGQSVSFALKKVMRSQVRKGMVVLPRTEAPPPSVSRFEANVLILYHNTLISPRYQAMMHIGSVRQTVQIEAILNRTHIRTGDRATVRFRFLKQPEYVKLGDRFVFREGRTKALGRISSVFTA